MHIPLYLPGLYSTENDTTILAGDIGGTKTKLAVFKTSGTELVPVMETSYVSADFASPLALMDHFFKTTAQPAPDCIALGVAGPVINGAVEITNLSWNLEAAALQQQTKAKKVVLLNDLEANAYGLAALTDTDIITLHPGNNSLEGNIAILAPGTGLGEAGLFWDGNSYHPFATEGGHCDFAPQAETDIALYHYLRRKFDHISWELVASGSAIDDLYAFLRDEQHIEEPEWLAAKLQSDSRHASAIISEAAMEQTSPLCVSTIQLFVRFIARAACNLVLKMKAVGGLYLSGGIPPKILPFFQSPMFYQTYRECDRMHDLVESVPIKMIMNEKTPLLGAAYYGAFGA